MLKSFMLLALVVTSGALISPANAQVERYDTRCVFDHCLRNGWNTYSNYGYRAETSCTLGDCALYGWNMVANDGSQAEISCRGRGCFIDGWSVHGWNRGRVSYSQDVMCRNNDCLRSGWIVRSSFDPYGEQVHCIGNDCARNGWDNYFRGGQSRLLCRGYDCFRFGWVLDAYRTYPVSTALPQPRPIL